MITIISPKELPLGIQLHMWQKDEAEAKRIVGNGKGYLMQSMIINALYLFVVV